MPRHLLLCVFASAMVLVATDSAQAEKKIYKWKDAAGVVHFSASPPPIGTEGATEVNVAGKNAPVDPAAAEAAKAAASTQPPVGASPPTEPAAPVVKTAEDLERERVAAELAKKAEACQAKREALLAANRRMHGESNEILTPQERIDLPKVTQRLENEIRAECQ